MGHEILTKLLRYVLIWIVILAILVVLSIIVNWENLVSVFSMGVTGLISGLITCVIVIGAIIFLLRIIFPF